MRLRMPNIWLRRNKLHRAVAIIFLLFTLVDIISPDLCEEELSGFPAEELTCAVHADNAPSTDVFSAQSSHNEDNSEPACEEGDCFCCCSHLIPINHFTLNIEIIQSSPEPPENTRLPSSPPQLTYHPPRFS